jgi:hypothetical protein
VTNGDGAFSSMIEVAEQKFFTSFSFADQTLQAEISVSLYSASVLRESDVLGAGI